MAQPIRHHCLIYDGSPAQNLPALAAITRLKLAEHYRCLYLNSPPMVDAMRDALAAVGVDVAGEEKKTGLVLSSDQGHLLQGHFSIDRMMDLLADALAQALLNGFQGLWATGDMTWQFGPRGDEDKLLDYEWRLEEFFRHNPGLCGVCQYHIDTLPPTIVREGLISHPALFINETLLRVNAHYVSPEVFSPATLQDPALDNAINELRRAAEKSG
jgi:hypothetical protein